MPAYSNHTPNRQKGTAYLSFIIQLTRAAILSRLCLQLWTKPVNGRNSTGRLTEEPRRLAEFLYYIPVLIDFDFPSHPLPTMRGAVVAILLLWLLPSQANSELFTVEAKCLSEDIQWVCSVFCCQSYQ